MTEDNSNTLAPRRSFLQMLGAAALASATGVKTAKADEDGYLNQMNQERIDKLKLLVKRGDSVGLLGMIKDDTGILAGITTVKEAYDLLGDVKNNFPEAVLPGTRNHPRISKEELIDYLEKAKKAVTEDGVKEAGRAEDDGIVTRRPAPGGLEQYRHIPVWIDPQSKNGKGRT